MVQRLRDILARLAPQAGQAHSAAFSTTSRGSASGNCRRTVLPTRVGNFGEANPGAPVPWGTCASSRPSKPHCQARMRICRVVRCSAG
jgi:hypothetical protein